MILIMWFLYSYSSTAIVIIIIFLFCFVQIKYIMKINTIKTSIIHYVYILLLFNPA